MNCVQVAVNLKTKELVWTPAFETFTRTRQLLVENLRTPVHTAIRWFRKRQELEGIYGNDEQAMALLSAAIHRLQQDKVKGEVPRGALLFGDLYANKHADVANALAPWMDLIQTNNRLEGYVDENEVPCEPDPIDLYTLNPRSLEGNPLVGSPAPVHAMPMLSRAHFGHWKKNICEQVIRVLEGSTDNLEYMHAMAYGSSVLETQLSQKRLAKSNNIRAKHRVSQYLEDLDLERCQAVLHLFAELASEYGVMVYGILENRDTVTSKEMQEDSIEKLKASFKFHIDKIIEHAKNTPSKAKVLEPLELPLGYLVSELTTEIELMEEGARMHHCVGGYHSAINAGSSRILSLRKHETKDCVTVELRRSKYGWHSVQARGAANRSTTTIENTAVAQACVAFSVTQWTRWLPGTFRRVVLNTVLNDATWTSQLYGWFNIPLPYTERASASLRSKVLRAVDKFLGGDIGAYRQSVAFPDKTFNLPSASLKRVAIEWLAILRLRGKAFITRQPAPSFGISRSYATGSGFDEMDDDIPS